VFKPTNILLEQMKTWWGKNISDDMINIILTIYDSKLKDNSDIKFVTERVKELFVQNIDNQRELSNTIDKYLIPQELEKKKNAEISTPYQLRQDMLNSINKYVPEFWKTKQKIFEPCCGKGGFLIDIIERFKKNGLKYKEIVEGCLYFSDINPTNIKCLCFYHKNMKT